MNDQKKYLLVGSILTLCFISLFIWKSKEEKYVKNHDTKHKKTSLSSNKKNMNKNNSINRSLSSVKQDVPKKDFHNREPAQIENPINYANVPPEIEELLKKYDVNMEASYQENTFYISSFAAIASKDYNSELGTIVEEKYDYIIYNPKDENTKSAVVINRLNHQVGIVTGKIIVKIDNNMHVLTQLAQKENFKIGYLRPYVNHQEINIIPATTSFELSHKLTKAGFSLAEIEIIEGKHTTR